ncbi:hypothetical protein FRC06_008824, partial [Ceratobasidium sp. 370]
MSSLCAALREVLAEYEEPVVDTEVPILQRGSELVANATVVPLSAIKATFATWAAQFTSLCELVHQLEAGPPPPYNLDPSRWPPGPLIDILLQRADRVPPQDRYAFDEAVERIKTNISEWLWSNVLTRQDVAVAIECLELGGDGLGSGERGAGRGRARKEDSAGMEARKRLLRCGWGVVREMIWFLDTLWGYIMMDVVDVHYRKLQSQLCPRRNRRNSSNTRAGTTRATSPTSTHFGPMSSNPNLYASTRPSLHASTHPSLHASTHAGGPDNSPDFLDFTALRTLHATYLGNIVSGSLIGHPGCAALVRTALERVSNSLRKSSDGEETCYPACSKREVRGLMAAWEMREIDKTFATGADASTMMVNTSMYSQNLFRPRAKGKLGDRAEDRRTVERLSLRLDFNTKFSESRR